MSPAATLGFLGATVALLACFAGLELLVRSRGIPSEVTWRAAHLLAACFAILAHDLLPLAVFLLVAVVFVLLMLASRQLHLLTSIHNTRRVSLGELYLPAGVAVAGLISGEHRAAFVAAVLVLGLADVAAGVVGDLLRSPSKTWWGTLAFVVVATAVVLVCGFSPLVAATVGVVGGFTERVSSRGTDNFTVPVVAALLLVFLQL